MFTMMMMMMMITLPQIMSVTDIGHTELLTAYRKIIAKYFF